MDKEDRKVVAFLIGMVMKLADGDCPDFNERQQLENLACEFDYYDLDEKKFRY